MIAIFDLDGTLALNEHRQHFLKETPKNWKAFTAAFTAACADDKPNMPIIRMTRMLLRDCHVYILSGRSAAVRDETINWLVKNKVVYDLLLMREVGDYRPDEILKQELLCKAIEVYKKYRPPPCNEDFIVFDDRQKVVDMWRDMGLTCCQVAKGDF